MADQTELEKVEREAEIVKSFADENKGKVHQYSQNIAKLLT